MGQTLKTLALTREEVIEDYRLGYKSRQLSLIGRREVMSGRAQFGVFGDGKEVPQLAMAKIFRAGDFRSGFYRDQTLMLATGMMSLQEYYAQLYAHADPAHDPASSGRMMNNHFGTRMLNPDGSWKNLTAQPNSSSDVSPTGSQMPRLVGLAYASRLFRELPELQQYTELTNGQEMVFGTIGNASCAEGMFWEAVNAIGVLKAPVAISIWDDEYGISVPNKYQVTKGDLSAILSGFQRENGSGYELFTVKAWDYPKLVETYQQVERYTRVEGVPTLVHVIEVTQPQGHSTSGSHERYKSKERLEWEREHDCLTKMRQWMIDEGVASDDEIAAMEEDDKLLAEQIREKAWDAYITPILEERQEVADMLDEIATTSQNATELREIKDRLMSVPYPGRRHTYFALGDATVALAGDPNPSKRILYEWKKQQDAINDERYGSHLYSQSPESALKVPEVKPIFSENSPVLNGFEVLNRCFDAALARDPRVIAFGEDVGYLGDVNQGFAGLQKKYGELRVSDTGIRELTILGQGIGMAMRGLRPIAELQYLDYLLYALQIMSDDLATVHWRTKGGQKAPVVVRTRGHRLVGIWHAGSQLAGVINLVRGMHVLVPRNMVQAAGFYNTLLRSDDPGLVIEVLNGYRRKERLPDNIGEFTVPLGVPEILREGRDVTLVTYGASVHLALEAVEKLSRLGVGVELIDVQSMLPFDLRGMIVESIKKTSRVVFFDEDVPGGGTAYMMQKVLEEQGGYHWLDSEPCTITAKEHRPSYGSDGDYFSKPSVEQLVETIYEIMHEANPAAYPALF